MSESRHNEDTPPQGYTYAWFSQSELPLEQFLTRVGFATLPTLQLGLQARCTDVEMPSIDHPWCKTMELNR